MPPINLPRSKPPNLMPYAKEPCAAQKRDARVGWLSPLKTGAAMTHLFMGCEMEPKVTVVQNFTVGEVASMRAVRQAVNARYGFLCPACPLRGQSATPAPTLNHRAATDAPLSPKNLHPQSEPGRPTLAVLALWGSLEFLLRPAAKLHVVAKRAIRAKDFP